MTPDPGHVPSHHGIAPGHLNGHDVPAMNPARIGAALQLPEARLRKNRGRYQRAEQAGVDRDHRGEGLPVP